MAEIVSCPSCQRKLQVPDNLSGQDVQCPTCSATFVAQTGTAPSPTPSAAPAKESPRPPERAGRKDWDDDGDDYGEPQTGHVRRRRRSDYEPHRGTMILVFGILSIVLGGLGLIFGPMAWIMGNADLRAIRAGRMDPEGEGQTNAGRVCGIVGTLLHGCVLLFVCGICFLGLLAGGTRR